MKKIIINVTAIILVLTSTFLSFDSCKLKDPLEGVKLIVKADATTAPSTFRIVDSKTNSQANIPGNLSVRISGQDEAYVFTPGGSKNLGIFQGLLNVSLRRGLVPTQQRPVSFNIEIDAPGYLGVVYPVTLITADPVTETISLVNISTPPTGSSVTGKTIIAGNDGKTSASVEIKVDVANGMQQTATVKLDAGTQLQDKNGNPVSGSVEATVIHFTPGNPQSLNSFPGGLNGNTIVNAGGGKLGSGTFTPGGWTYIEMKAGGAEVKKFDKPIHVVMEIAANIINPVTNMPFKAGDEMNVYSKSEGATDWVLEGTTILTTNNSSGKLEAVISMNHLSTVMAAHLDQACGTPLVLNVENPFGGLTVKFDILEENGLFFDTKTQVMSPNLNRIVFNKPLSQNSKYIISCSFMGYEFFRSPLMTLCNGTNNVAIPAGIAPKNVNFNIFIKCPDNAIILPQNTIVYFINENTYQNTLVPGGNGGSHKPEPADVDPVSHKLYWNSTTIEEVNITEGGKPARCNRITIDQSFFKPGQSYRFAVYYDTEKGAGSRADIVFPREGEPALTQQSIDALIMNDQKIEIIFTSCDF